MDTTAVLCNHAESQNNMLYLSGAGIDRVFVPAGSAPPYGVVVGIGIIVRVPWTQTNQPHTVAVELVDEDTRPVEVPQPDGSVAAFAPQMGFNIGRPPTLAVGDEQSVALAINIPGLPLPRLGRFRFLIKIDGTDVQELPYQVLELQSLNVGVGPTALPPSI